VWRGLGGLGGLGSCDGGASTVLILLLGVQLVTAAVCCLLLLLSVCCFLCFNAFSILRVDSVGCGARIACKRPLVCASL